MLGDERPGQQDHEQVTARAVKHEGDMLVVRDRRSESIEKRLHTGRVRVGQDQRESVVSARLDHGIDIGVDIALIDGSRRALAAFPPDAAGAPFLPDARFILKIQAQAFLFVRRLYFSQGSQGSF